MAFPKSYATILTGLSHPRRIKIMNTLLLQKGAVTHGNLQALLKFNAQAMTHHLGQMEKAGLIRRVRLGRETHISLETHELSHCINDIKRQCSFPALRIA